MHLSPIRTTLPNPLADLRSLDHTAVERQRSHEVPLERLSMLRRKVAVPGRFEQDVERRLGRSAAAAAPLETRRAVPRLGLRRVLDPHQAGLTPARDIAHPHSSNPSAVLADGHPPRGHGPRRGRARRPWRRGAACPSSGRVQASATRRCSISRRAAVPVSSRPPCRAESFRNLCRAAPGVALARYGFGRFGRPARCLREETWL